MMELSLDARVYDTKQVTIVEIMGRNAGWLTAASALAGFTGHGPDLIYLPELAFDLDKFIADIKRVLEGPDKKCIVALSEGIKTKEGIYVAEAIEAANNATKDSFGHTQLGGVATALGALVKEKIGCKVRAIEFNLMQRCAAHLASAVDVEEAFEAGATAVRAACAGETDKMVVFERDASCAEYKCIYKLIPLEIAANTEKTVPLSWIGEDGTNLKKEFIDYAMPLIQGSNPMPLENGLPRFAKLKKVRV